MMRWIVLFLLLLPFAYSLEQPCFNEAVLKGNGSMRVFLLNWTASPELDVAYSLYSNYSSTPLYGGNLSQYYVDIYEGPNHFGISAKTFNDSRVCEGNIQYNRNKPPSAPFVDCQDSVDVEASIIICNITYDSVDSDNDSLLYAYFVDEVLKVADVNSQNLEVGGIAQGMHNISICAFDGEFFSCGYDTVSFTFIPAPVFQNVYVANPAIPFYGNLVQSYLDIRVTINDTRECAIVGKISQDNEAYAINCSKVSDYYDCYVNLTYEMSSGKYDLSLTANNGIKSQSYSKSNAVDVYEVLGGSVTSPEFDLTQVFDGWVTSQEPAVFTNLGAIRFRNMLFDSNSIVCIGTTFSNITVGIENDLSESKDVSNGAVYTGNVNSGEGVDFYVFIYNPSRANPRNCNSIWSLEAYRVN